MNFASDAATRRYDPAADAWTTGLAAMPFAYGFSSASVNGKCYAFGNAYSGSAGNEIYEFDPAVGWTKLPATLSSPLNSTWHSKCQGASPRSRRA